MTKSNNFGESVILDWATRSELTKLFVEDSSVQKFVFGCNQLGLRISQLVHITGFIDDQMDSDIFNGFPVIRSTEIPTKAIVVSAIVGVLPVSVERLLHSRGVDHVDYFSFLNESRLDLLPVPFWGNAQEDMNKNLKRYELLEDRMGDDESKQVLSDFINFRKTLDLRYLESYSNRQSEQYFESFLQLDQPNINFFDLGCFDGFTSLEFARLSPRYGSISAFEPIPRLYHSARDNLRNLGSCTIYNFGASDRDQIAYFSDAGSSSAHSASGDVQVELRRLDDQILPSPNLVKIDIEGSEIEALWGMQKYIAKSKPAFAVACYHYPHEMLELVDFWDHLNLQGSLHMRHYTEGTTETVVFLVPA